MAKKYDLAVKTGSYIDAHGEKKARYRNIGVVMDGENGPFIMLNRDFNPAGVPFREGSESILVSMFAPKDRDERGGGGAASRAEKPRESFATDLDDEIPF